MNAQTSPPLADDPQEKPYPGYAREVAALAAKAALASRASAEPFPGALKDAFIADPPVVHGYNLQPVSMGLIMLLKKIKSPLLDIMRIMREELSRVDDTVDESTPELRAAARASRLARANERISAEINPEDETMSGTILCFLKPLSELRGLLRGGLDAFNEKAQQELGDKLAVNVMTDMQRAVSAHYSNSFVTAIRYAAPKGKDDGGFPTPPPGPLTASAGG